MNKKNIQSPCERMRFRALRDGEGSPAEILWKQHAKNCRECQASLRIMDLLNTHDTEEKVSLPPEMVTDLIGMARQRYSQPMSSRFIAFAKRSIWKVAVVACVLLLACNFFPMQHLLDRSVSIITSAAIDKSIQQVQTAQITPAKIAASDSCETALLSAATPADASAMPELIPGESMDSSIFELRTQIDSQFESLYNLIDRDLTEF